MPKGGSRTRSGPTKDPRSRTSERAGYQVTALPNEGYKRRPPGLTNFIPKPTARHRAHWVQLWKTPQACAWSMESWRWPQIARLCQLLVRAEAPDAPAAIYSEIVKLEAKHGLSDDGMRYLGWSIARDEVAAKAAARAQTSSGPAAPTSERRLRAAADAQ